MDVEYQNVDKTFYGKMTMILFGSFGMLRIKIYKKKTKIQKTMNFFN